MTNQQIQDPLKHAVQSEDVQALSQAFLDIKLYPIQEKIVRDIVFEKERRIIINTYTQFGKTFTVGVALAIKVILSQNVDQLNIGLLGPAKDDARGIRDPMIENGLNCQEFRDAVDTSQGSDPEDMQKSRSKDLLTFDEGSIKVECLSASSGGSGDGEGLMGDGVDILVMDESNRISQETYKDSVDRMLNEWDTILIEMGNPKHQNNQFYEHWTSENYKKYHVGEHKLTEYEDAVIPERLTTASGLEMGRHPKKFFDEKAGNVNGRDSVRYAWKYKSIFPDQVEDGLINKAWLREAQDKKFDLEDPDIVYSIDVAGEGDDKIVLTRRLEKQEKVVITDQWVREYSNDERKTCKWACAFVKEEPKEVNKFVVDAMGIGNGLHSRLDDRGFTAVKFKAGEKPDGEEGDYENKKARNFFKLRQALMDGDVEFREGWKNSDLDMPENELFSELGHMKREPGRRNTDKVADPKGKSPDFADSLMMSFYKIKKSKAQKVSNPFSV